jgi:hypothetical protein
MFNAYITLFIALSISATAAYYSIAGLIAIFSAAAMPIAIMGAVLETGKVATTAWLHRNWKTAPRFMKIYLTTAVGVLMFITSMGIFGYLSKAHINQSTGMGESKTRIEKLEIKVEAERRTIKRAENEIGVLDSALDRYIELGAVSTSLRKREEQESDRLRLNKIIKGAQVRLDKHLEEKATLELEIKNFEAEVGPVKYIAELLYGEGESSHIEDAVRFVILILVFVFDPLAILLLVAADISLDNYKKEKRKKERALQRQNAPKPRRPRKPKILEQKSEPESEPPEPVPELSNEEKLMNVVSEMLQGTGQNQLEIVVDEPDTNENVIEDGTLKTTIKKEKNGMKKVVKTKNGISMEYYE